MHGFRVADLPVAQGFADGLIDGLRIWRVHRGLQVLAGVGRGRRVFILFLRARWSHGGRQGERQDDPDPDASSTLHNDSSHVCSSPVKIARTDLRRPGIREGGVVPVHLLLERIGII
jgi:hypothetical protein